MRLHRLRLTAFGPFAGEEQVDFDALGDAGLFLFHGPTGAGKTSLLDAVCFALYGQVPGSRGAVRALRSDHAPPGTRPEVRLELTVRSRRLRITRSPAWERPKHRGEGTTTEQARVLLEDVGTDGSATTVTTRIDEAGHELSGLLRMTHAQFTQVALLPQGQFARFLRADADERRDLLSTLFDTQRFTAVEQHLVTMRQQAARALGLADDAVADVVSRIREVVSSDADEASELDDAAVRVLLDDATTQTAQAAASASAAATARETASTAHLREVALAKSLARLASLRARSATLASQAATRTVLAGQLAESRRAAPVVQLAEQTRLLSARLSAELKALRHETALETLGVELPVAVGAETAIIAGRLRDREAGARTEVGALAGLVDTARQVEGLRAELVELERAEVQHADRQAVVTEWLEGHPQRRAAVERRLQDARAAVIESDVVRERLAGIDSRLDAAGRRTELTTRLTTVEHELRAAVDAAQAAQAHWLDLRARRLDGIAAELAARLVPGEPCEVCGSTEHPAPAQADDRTVDRADEDAALAAVERCDATRIDLETESTRLDRALAQAELVAGELSASELGELRLEVAERLAALEVVAADVDAAAQAMHDLHREVEARVTDQQSTSAALASARTRLEGLRQQVSTLGGQVDTARGEDPTVDARMSRLVSIADAAAELAGRLDGLVAMHDELARAEATAEEAAATAGFPNLAAARAAVLSDATAEQAEALLRQLAGEEATLAEQLADPDLIVAAVGPPAQVEVTAAALAAAEATLERAVAHRANAEHSRDALIRLAADLEARLGVRAPLARAHAVVDGLSRLTEGKSADNQLRMSLTAYVLAARLEQVAAVASDRLDRMSGGRYRLTHSALSPKGRGGLHLQVVDAWTGHERDPATLSGGESFYASLALALGLAEVVTAEAGGTPIETLFVDEGFGSLDEETLDEVMDVLDGLRAGGRTVGVVSHVADLRQRIPAQVHVRKGRQGSSVVQSLGAPDA